MDHDVLMDQMEERFREEFAKAPKALEDAPDGHWIEASEMALRVAALIVGREGLELALQARIYLARPHFAVLVVFENIVLAANPRPLCVAYGFGPSSP